MAYAGGTEATRWLRRYKGPGNGLDELVSVRVSPDGATVFVTGSSYGSTGSYDYATVA